MRIITFVICILMLCGCVPTPLNEDAELLMSPDDIIDNVNEGDQGDINPPDEVCPPPKLSMWDLSELSIDMSKIAFYTYWDYDLKEDYPDPRDDLKDMIPDLILAEKKEYKYHSEDQYWHSNSTGLTYKFDLYENDKYGVHGTFSSISGQISDLIQGLTASVEMPILMNALDIPDCHWSIGEPPQEEDVNIENYFGGEFRTMNSNQLLFIIPDQRDNPVTYVPMGILITPSYPGLVSPTDEMLIRMAAVFP